MKKYSSRRSIMEKKTPLTPIDIRNSILLGLKFFVINLATSALIFGLLFLIALVMGFEGSEADKYFYGPVIQTILMPLIIWYYGYVAYNDGYRHSVAEMYDKRRITIAAIPILAIQIIIVLIYISEQLEAPGASTLETGSILAKFIFAPFAIIFELFPMAPELLFIPCLLPPIAIYTGYHLSRYKEVEDHSISDDAVAFRKKLEQEQYKYDDQNNDNK